MDKIKVLHIIKSLGRGGAEMLLPETLKLHDKMKFDFHYLYFLPWKDQVVDEIKRAGGEVNCFPAKNNIQLLLQYKKVIRYCENYHIDIIHCHLPWSGFLGRLVYKYNQIPVIYTEHNIQERYHKATKAINKFTFDWQSMALGVSEDVTDSIKNNIRPGIPVNTLLNGVNIHHFERNKGKGRRIKEKYKIPDDSLVIGNVAVFREQKNLPDWLRAFKEINRKYPDVYGILVGAGVKEEEIKNLIREFDLTEKVKLPGLQTDTISFFSAMDIFMMSSSFEGLPIALLEAMSTGCAVVSTKAGGVVEAVRNKKDGLLCDVGDWHALADAAKLLVTDPEKRRGFQVAARQRVKRNFSLEAMVQGLETHYLKILKNEN